jgi:hypothetical protein
MRKAKWALWSVLGIAVILALAAIQSSRAEFDDLSSLLPYASTDKTVYFDTPSVDKLLLNEGVGGAWRNGVSAVTPVSVRSMRLGNIRTRDLLSWVSTVEKNHGWKRSYRMPGQISIAKDGMTGSGTSYIDSDVEVKFPKGVDPSKLRRDDVVNVTVVDTKQLSSRDQWIIRLMHFGSMPYEKL